MVSEGLVCLVILVSLTEVYVPSPWRLSETTRQLLSLQTSTSKLGEQLGLQINLLPAASAVTARGANVL